MLGMGRAGEYAGWWNTGIKSIAFNGSSSMVPLIQQSPEFSLNTISYGLNEVQTQTVGATVVTGGAWNITGLTGFTGYNDYSMTSVFSVYLPWASGITNQSEWALWNQQIHNSGSNYDNAVNISIVSGSLRLSVDGQTKTLSGSYTNYTNKWITIVNSRAPTSASFANWTGGSSSGGNPAVRLAVYNTQTGAVIVIFDYFGTAPGLNPPLSSLPSSLQPYDGVTDPSMAFSIGGQTGLDQITGAWWITIGQMFDPTTTTDLSWLTSNPSAVISNAKAWSNLQFANYANLGLDITSDVRYYILDNGQSLWSQPNSYAAWVQTSTNANWTSIYSNTNIIRNN